MRRQHGWESAIPTGVNAVGDPSLTPGLWLACGHSLFNHLLQIHYEIRWRDGVGLNVIALFETGTPHSMLDKSKQVILWQSGDIVVMHAVAQTTTCAGCISGRRSAQFCRSRTKVIWLALEEWHNRPQAALLDEALKNGESQTVEFKEGHPASRKPKAAFPWTWKP
jgi:hypothetical protein